MLDYLKSVGHELYQLPPAQHGSIVQAISIDKFGDEEGSVVVTANHDWRKDGGVDGF